MNLMRDRNEETHEEEILGKKRRSKYKKYTFRKKFSSSNYYVFFSLTDINRS